MASVWRYSLHAILIGWTLLQLTIPLIRYDAAVANLKYFNNYPPIQDPQVTQIFPILNYIKQNDVDVMVSDFDLYPSDVVDAWTIMLSDQVQLVPFYSPRYSGQQWWSQLDQVPSFWIVTPNRDYFEASDIGTRVVGESGSLSLYAITPDDIDRLLNNADLLNPAIPEPMITNMSFLSVLAENDTVRSFMGSAIVRFLATGEQNAGFYIEYTPDHEGELPLSLNGEIIEQKTLQANRQDTVYLCSQPKPGINTLAFEVQGGQASVKVSALQLSLSSLPASIDIGTGTDVAFLEDGWYAPDTLGGGLNLRWAKLEASLRIVRKYAVHRHPHNPTH